jgi:hypothetical protein
MRTNFSLLVRKNIEMIGENMIGAGGPWFMIKGQI